MSGTSLDGVDAVLADVSAVPCRVVRSFHLAYSDELRGALVRLRNPAEDELNRAAIASAELAKTYAQCVSGLLPAGAHGEFRIAAIGCHGQTVRHRPELGYSIQIGNAAMLAELTGITVVADFRSRDLAAGGQGAPLVPAFHEAVFRDPDRHRIVLNLGGIANLTDLPFDGSARGFDCGPGNTLMDAWIGAKFGRRYDENGELAASGNPLAGLLASMMNHPFLALAPPKSCGQEQFDLRWVESLLSGAEGPADVQATLLEFTATSAAQAMDRWCAGADEILVCGGGVRNAALMNRLAEQMAPARTRATDAAGIAAEQVEAAAFAWLAKRAMEGRPGNVPEATGARGPRVLGAIYPA